MNRLLPKIILCVIVSVGLGSLVGYLTSAGVDTWFQTINKPAWQPPNWVFGPVWSILYALIGASFALIWQDDSPLKKKAISIFFIQFALNMLWSFLFFKWHNIGLALVEIILLLLSIIMTIVYFHKINKIAAYLLIPYLAWVSFATVLNAAIWHLN